MTLFSNDELPKSGKHFESVDDYIAMFPSKVQEVLKQLEQAIKVAAQNTKETISYQMPPFKLKGTLIHFAVWKKIILDFILLH